MPSFAQHWSQVAGPLSDRSERPRPARTAQAHRARIETNLWHAPRLLAGSATAPNAFSKPCGDIAAITGKSPGLVADGGGGISEDTQADTGEGSGDRDGYREPLMITSRAVSALPLHH